MAETRLRYQGGAVGDRDAFRLAEPEMSDEEYEAYRAAWWQEFPCHCQIGCLCQGPPPVRPKRVRILMEFPDEPPRLPPDAASAVLRLLLKAAEKQGIPMPGTDQ